MALLRVPSGLLAHSRPSLHPSSNPFGHRYHSSREPPLPGPRLPPSARFHPRFSLRHFLNLSRYFYVSVRMCNKILRFLRNGVIASLFPTMSLVDGPFRPFPRPTRNSPVFWRPPIQSQALLGS